MRSNATQTDGVGEVQPPEAKGLSRVGRGKGGGVSRATKCVLRDLHTDDRIPIRDIPKTILDMYVLIFHEPPTEAQLITHSHIADNS